MQDLIKHLEASGLHPVIINENTVFPNVAPDTPSPYLPETNIRYAWDSTCLSAFKTCPRYYQYSILEGWTSREESVHLRFGIEYHQALHDYELGRNAGASHDDALFDTVRELLLR